MAIFGVAKLFKVLKVVNRMSKVFSKIATKATKIGFINKFMKLKVVKALTNKFKNKILKVSKKGALKTPKNSLWKKFTPLAV